MGRHLARADRFSTVRTGRWVGSLVVVAVLVASGLAILPPAHLGPRASPGFRTESAEPSGHAVPVTARPTYRTGIPVSGAVHDRIASVPLRAVSGSYLETIPAWLQYDARTDAFYVAAPLSSVDIITNASFYDSTVSATVPVGTDPFGVAYDNATGDVFVTNTGSDNVSVLYGELSHPVAAIAVGAGPTGVAYDPVNGAVYVANSVSNSVSVINATTFQVIATVPVGVGPIGVAADPSGGAVYVADNGSDQVSVISANGNGVLATVAVGSAPYGIAVDNASDTVYVTNTGSHNLSAISELNYSVVATVPVGATAPAPSNVDLQGAVYDWEDGLLWLTGGRNTVIVVDPATETIVSTIFYDPSGIALDPANGNICVTNSLNATFACVLSSYGTIGAPGIADLTSAVSLDFRAAGLPTGSMWELSLAPYGPTFESRGGSIDFDVYPNWSYAFSIVADPPYWASPSSGVVDVGGAAATVGVRFSNTTSYPVNFTEVGLPRGAVWYANISGEADLTSTSPTSNVSLGNGTYNYTVATNNPDYQPAPSNGSFVVQGIPLYRSAAFSASPVYVLTFAERGLPTGTGWEVALDGALRSSEAVAIPYAGPNGTYAFQVGAVPGYSPYPISGTFSVSGASVTVVVSFEPVGPTGPVGGTKNVPTSAPYELFGLPGNEGWLVLGGLVAVAIAGALALGFGLGRRPSGVHGPPSIPPGAGAP